MEGIIRVASDVYVYVGGKRRTKFDLVTTNRNSAVIDNDVRYRKAFLGGIRKISKKPVGHIFGSHHNFDHTSDNVYYHKRGAVSFES